MYDKCSLSNILQLGLMKEGQLADMNVHLSVPITAGLLPGRLVVRELSKSSGLR